MKLPKDYNGVCEQIIRPTGLLDPVIEIRPYEKKNKNILLDELKKYKLKYQYEKLLKFNCSNQIDDLIGEIKSVTKRGQRVLVTTLTKRMSEDLTSYLKDIGIKVHYLHSEIDTIERVEILRDLRLGKYDVVVGINLLREGLDLPEVSLVAILDADKEGFLRSEVSLIQIIGRASRHKEGRVIMYADNITKSIYNAVLETERRRKIQEEYNKKHCIEPVGIKKDIDYKLEKIEEYDKEIDLIDKIKGKIKSFDILKKREKQKLLNELEIKMLLYADQLEFEKALVIRNLLFSLKNKRFN